MRKALSPPLSPHDMLVDGLRLMLGEGLAHYHAHRDGVLAGEMEAIHQARVALRRLRSVLRLLRRHLDPVAHDGFDDALRGLARMLGDARDWDVFTRETVPMIASADPDRAEALRALLPAAERRRAEAHATLSQVMAQPRTAEILLDLADWSSRRAAFFPKSEAGRRLAKRAPHLLDRLQARLHRHGRELDTLDDEGRHDLRKALKALRYGMEMLETLYERDAVRDYRQALSALQEDLGALNDAIAARMLVERLPALPGRDAVRDWADARRTEALATLPAAWDGVGSIRQFWSPRRSRGSRAPIP